MSQPEQLSSQQCVLHAHCDPPPDLWPVNSQHPHARAATVAQDRAHGQNYDALKQCLIYLLAAALFLRASSASSSSMERSEAVFLAGFSGLSDHSEGGCGGSAWAVALVDEGGPCSPQASRLLSSIWASRTLQCMFADKPIGEQWHTRLVCWVSTKRDGMSNQMPAVSVELALLAFLAPGLHLCVQSRRALTHNKVLSAQGGDELVKPSSFPQNTGLDRNISGARCRRGRVDVQPAGDFCDLGGDAVVVSGLGDFRLGGGGARLVYI